MRGCRGWRQCNSSDLCIAARAAAGLGWAVLVAGLLWCGLYLHTRHQGGEVAGLAQLRARLGPGWRQEDLLALRTRVRAQFRCEDTDTY